MPSPTRRQGREYPTKFVTLLQGLLQEDNTHEKREKKSQGHCAVKITKLNFSERRGKLIGRNSTSKWQSSNVTNAAMQRITAVNEIGYRRNNKLATNHRGRKALPAVQNLQRSSLIVRCRIAHRQTSYRTYHTWSPQVWDECQQDRPTALSSHPISWQVPRPV